MLSPGKEADAFIWMGGANGESYASTKIRGRGALGEPWAGSLRMECSAEQQKDKERQKALAKPVPHPLTFAGVSGPE